jgi:flagellar capping protein FliD
VSASYSATKIKETVEDIIAELNAYKSDINALGFIDEVGNEDGPLQNSSYLKSAKRQFSKLMTSPIVGFGDKNIYFVDFGIKTAKDGSLVFDQTTFDRTFVNEPEKFDALTKDKVYSDDSQSTPYSVTDAGLPPGKYQYQQSNQKLFSYTSSQAITTTLSGSATDYTRTADGYPGFLIKSNLDNPADYNIYIGHSVKTKLNNFFTDVLASSGQLDATVDLYKERVSSLDAKLAKIDQREALLQAQYTKQFSEMEKVVNTSTSSADYVTQLVDGWNKS